MIKFLNTNNAKFNKGFSLLETLVALAILNAAILGPITLAINSIRSASLSHNIAIASFLAEEAAELVRAKREENIYTNNNWLDGFDCTDSNPCIVSMAVNGEIDVVPCVSSCAPLNYDSVDGLYLYGSGNASIFTRTFTAEEIEDEKEVKIIVKVSWKERFLGDKNVELESHLFNWRN